MSEIEELRAQADEWRRKFALLRRLGVQAQKRYEAEKRTAERRIGRLMVSKKTAEDERDAARDEIKRLDAEIKALQARRMVGSGP